LPQFFHISKILRSSKKERSASINNVNCLPLMHVSFQMNKVRRFPYIILMLLTGCATEQLKVERGLVAARFTPMRGTPEVAARLKEYPPYAFIQFTEKNKKPRYVFSSPARRTIFVGDEAAMKRYSAYLTAQQQSEQMRRLQGQQRAANFQQALASGLAAGAMNASQQPVYNQPPFYHAPPPLQPFSPPPRTTSFMSDGAGGFQGTDGSTIQRDGFGGYRVTEGY
jgi:hypothetical protein